MGAGTGARAAFLLQAVCDVKHHEEEAHDDVDLEAEASFRFLKTVRAFRLAKLTTVRDDDDDGVDGDGNRQGQGQRKHERGGGGGSKMSKRSTASAACHRAGALLQSVEEVSDAFAAFELLLEVLGLRREGEEEEEELGGGGGRRGRHARPLPLPTVTAKRYVAATLKCLAVAAAADAAAPAQPSTPPPQQKQQREHEQERHRRVLFSNNGGGGSRVFAQAQGAQVHHQSANDVLVSETSRALIDGYIAAAAAAAAATAAAEGDMMIDEGSWGEGAAAAAESHLALVRFAMVSGRPQTRKMTLQVHAR